ncbi:MAG: class I SAM-dependent methyltransferase [Vicinamibacterales bacterium]
MPQDTKQSEREYVIRAGSERWEWVKPFSTPGHDDVREASRLVQDFAAMLACLEPRPGERVLDLGAGSCWCSEWLQRLNVETISVDIAIDMLRIGRERLPGPARLVAGDLEQLPLAGASVDKAVCLNALHHVPDRRRMLCEVWRVLRPGGAVFFSEPGRGHSESEASRAAVGAAGVLEEDVLVQPFVEECVRAGFSQVRVKPLAHIVPWFEADLGKWRAWERAAAMKRPVRALEKMGRAFVEALGFGKKGPLVSEALGMELIRIFRDATDHHPIVFARK